MKTFWGNASSTRRAPPANSGGSVPGASRGLAVRGGILALAAAVLAAAILPTAAWLDGRAGVAAAAAAGAICAIGASLALAISHLLRGPALVLPGLLLAMTARSGLPLLLAIVIQFRGGPLAEAGFLYYLLVFYFVILSVETVLSLPRPLAASRPSEAMEQ
jgi:hypothetical protein